MSGYDKMKETGSNLEADSPKKSVSMIRQNFEGKIREAKEAEEASLKVKGSMEGPLDVKDIATSSKTNDTKETKRGKDIWKKNIKDNLNVKDVATSGKTHDAEEVNEKEKKEKKKEILAELQEEMYSLTRRLDDLRIDQFAYSRASEETEAGR